MLLSTCGLALVLLSVGGVPVPVEELGKVDGINLLADDQNFYWVSGHGPHVIHALGKATGSKDRVLAQEATLQAMAQDGARLYWLTNQGDIRTIQKSGGAVSTIHASDGNVLGGLAVAGEELVTTNPSGEQTCEVVAFAKKGGAVRIVAEGLPSASGMAVSGDSVYLGINAFLPEGPYGVLRIPLNGKGKPRSLTTEKVGGNFVDETRWEVSGGVLRWVSGETIRSTSVDGRGAGPNAAAKSVTTMATDSTHLYWHDSTSVWRVPLKSTAATKPQLVAQLSAKQNVRCLLLDATSIYATVGGTLVRVKKP